MSTQTEQPLIWLARNSTSFTVVSGRPARFATVPSFCSALQSAGNDQRGVLDTGLHELVLHIDLLGTNDVVVLTTSEHSARGHRPPRIYACRRDLRAKQALAGDSPKLFWLGAHKRSQSEYCR